MVSLGGPDLFKVLTTIIAPKVETDASIIYDDLIQKLKSHFTPKKNIIAECFKFFKRIQNFDESLQEYIVELKQLSQHCEFGLFQDKALLIQFVCGINCSKIQQHILNDDKIKTFEKATEVAIAMEMTNGDINILKGHSGEGNVNAVSSHQQRSWGQREYRGRRTSQERNSRQSGERQSHSNQRYNQKQREVRCYACGAYGHIKRYCRKRQSSEINKLETDENEDNEYFECGYINNCKSYRDFSHKVKLQVEKHCIEFEVDTGGCETIIDLNYFHTYFKNLIIIKDVRKMKFIFGDYMDTFGKINVKVFVCNQIFNLELTILNT